MSLIYRYVVSFLSQFITPHIYDLNILHYIIDNFIHLYIINTINIGNTVLDTQKKITLHTYTHYHQTLKKNVIIGGKKIIYNYSLLLRSMQVFMNLKTIFTEAFRLR